MRSSSLPGGPGARRTLLELFFGGCGIALRYTVVVRWLVAIILCGACGSRSPQPSSQPTEWKPTPAGPRSGGDGLCLEHAVVPTSAPDCPEDAVVVLHDGNPVFNAEAARILRHMKWMSRWQRRARVSCAGRLGGRGEVVDRRAFQACMSAMEPARKDTPTSTGPEPHVGQDRRVVCMRLGGERHGPYRELWPTGTIKRAGRFIDGMRQGAWTEWSTTGQLVSVIVYDRGRELSRRQCAQRTRIDER